MTADPGRLGGTLVAPAGLAMRPLAGDEDYWRLRELLRRTMVRNDRRQRSWHVARLDYWWWFANPDLEHLDPAAHVFLWETTAGELVAARQPRGAGEAHLQVDPAVASPELDEAMIAVAEERLAIPYPDGRRRLRVFVDARDASRQAHPGAAWLPAARAARCWRVAAPP